MNQRILILFFFSSILTTSAQSLNLELLKGNWTHTDTGGGVTGEFWKISGQGAIGEGYHIFLPIPRKFKRSCILKNSQETGVTSLYQINKSRLCFVLILSHPISGVL